MKHLKIFIVSVCLIFFTITTAQNVELQHPDWFLYPSKYPSIIIGLGSNASSALENAKSMYSLHNKCIVHGILEFYTDPVSEEFYRNSEYYYDFSIDIAEMINDSLRVLDHYIINTLTNDYVEAFTLDTNYSLNPNRNTPFTLQPPGWIEKSFSKDDDYYYGTGMYTSKGRDTDAWITSEERAIFSILNSVAVQLHKITIVEKSEVFEDTLEEILIYKFKFLLKEISVVERYPDMENQLYYTLVRIGQDDVITSLVK